MASNKAIIGVVATQGQAERIVDKLQSAGFSTGPRDRMIARLERGSRETGEDPLLVARCVQKIISSTEPPLRWIIGDHTARVIEARKKLSQNDFAALVRRELGLWPGKAS